MVAIRVEKILQHRDNVAPGSSNCVWQEKLAPLRFSSRDSGLDFPAVTLAAAGASALVVLVVTFQRLNNQHKQATGNRSLKYQVSYSGACYGR